MEYVDSQETTGKNKFANKILSEIIDVAFIFLSPVTVPLQTHYIVIAGLYRHCTGLFMLPLLCLYNPLMIDFLTVQYRHYIGHLMAASTMPLQNQNAVFLMGWYWPGNGPLPYQYWPVNRQCADRYWACTEHRYETIIRECTGPLLARYKIVCWD